MSAPGDSAAPSVVVRARLLMAAHSRCPGMAPASGYTCRSCGWLENADGIAHQAEVLAFAGLLRPEPRVFRAGDPEPGEDVWVVRDRGGFVWSRVRDGWMGRHSNLERWIDIARDSEPLVEVFLPEPVLE